jgi:lipopolysaccharide export system permease protein
MFLLDRYLLRQFLQIFLICFSSLFGLYVVIDSFSNIEDFMRFAGGHGNLWAIMGQYYGIRSLAFFDRTSGILTLIAAMFTVAMFQRFSEMTAIQAAGIGKWRVLKPVVGAVIAITIAAAINREIVIPMFLDHFSRNAQDLGGEVGQNLYPHWDYKNDLIIRGQHTFANLQRIEKPTFVFISKDLNTYGKNLTANDAVYQPADGRHPNGYLFKGVTSAKDLAAKPSLAIDGQAVLLTPHDYPWLAADECFVASDVSFEQLASGIDWRQYAAVLDLIDGLRNPSLGLGADVRVAVHARLMQPILDINLLLLGLPLLLSRSNRNLFVAIGLCVALVVVFYLVVLGFQYLGTSYLVSPALAAWCPLMIFVPLAAAMSDPLRE